MTEITADTIAAAVRTLDAGGLLVMPTDTVYGLAAAAGNRKALAGLFAAKGRPAIKPLVVMVADQAAAMRLVDFPAAAKTLAEAFWPGPLTLVLPWPGSLEISTAVTAGGPTIGLRVPDHPAALAILRTFGQPLAVTSANRSGEASGRDASQIEAMMGPDVDLILDGGPSPSGIASTILAVAEDGLRLMRPGALGVNELAMALGIQPSEIAS